MLPRQLMLDFDGRRLQGERPLSTFEARGSSWQWTRHHARVQLPGPAQGSGDALAEVQRALHHYSAGLGSNGAAVGFISYDAARQIEPRSFGTNSPPDDLQSPDIRLTFCASLSQSALDPSGHQHAPPKERNAGAAWQPDPRYVADVARILEYIAAGDIYQANYTQRFTAALPCPPAEFYRRLIEVHSMPFSALLEWDDLAVVSNSPERFLKLSGRRLLAEPIKGTIRRSPDPQEDQGLRERLASSAKDRAENVMIVDLLRNDLGRVCEWGSVAVPRLFEVQTFPTLHHLVSRVTGTLRTDLDGVDALRAAFPCGSITGAPKIRAMQIIDGLEPVRRGIAMGSIGYFGFNGDMEWNVAIRTATCIANTVYFHAGGGIVADSDPDLEYAEMQLKARALLSATLDLTGRERDDVN